MSAHWTAWWDFLWEGNKLIGIAVQTDHPKDDTDYIAKFTADESGMDEASSFIKDILAGRKYLMEYIKNGVRRGNS